MGSTHSRRHAFTLVEMSIVLAIIGLLVGGIFAGTSILKQAELKSIVADYTKYSSATNQFIRTYGGPPGDLLDATSYWGDDNAVCPDPAITNGNPGTCNGNGDGQIPNSSLEGYRAWQQLVLAGLINGNYTGTNTGGIIAGTNVPKSRITNAAWAFAYKAPTSGNSVLFNQGLGNTLSFGLPSVGTTQNAVITTEDAKQLDGKMDDGMPGTGLVIAFKPAFPQAPNCADSSVDATAQYKLAYTGTACFLYMGITK